MSDNHAEDHAWWGYIGIGTIVAIVLAYNLFGFRPLTGLISGDFVEDGVPRAFEVISVVDGQTVRGYTCAEGPDQAEAHVARELRRSTDELRGQYPDLSRREIKAVVRKLSPVVTGEVLETHECSTSDDYIHFLE